MLFLKKYDDLTITNYEEYNINNIPDKEVNIVHLYYNGYE